MISNKIKKLIIGFAALVSLNAEAKVEQFLESFSGVLAQDVMIDADYFSGQSTFYSTIASLTTNHEVLSFFPDFYFAFGSFTRTDSTGSFTGMFDLSTQVPDYSSTNLQLSGTFYMQNLDSLENTGAYANAFFTGMATGYVNNQVLNLTIDWTIVTPDSVSSVPVPPTAWLFASGLLMLGWVNSMCKQRSESAMY